MDGTLWNEEWFEEWLHELDRKIEMQGKKVVMIVNNCSAHPEVSRLKTTNLQFLPPNTTSSTEPMDQWVIRYVCFIIFLFYWQSQSNRNRMLRFCCRRFSLRKVGLPPSENICVICFIESSLKMMKVAFYFILKALFVLKIFKFLSWLFGHAEKTAWLERSD